MGKGSLFMSSLPPGKTRRGDDVQCSCFYFSPKKRP